MPTTLQTATNNLILNAAINKEPPFDSFKRLCKTRGNRNMDYLDFEWKYYQFYHGSHDLSAERSPDNSSSVTLSDLPLHILQKVIKPLALSDRLVLRKVSSSLRDLQDHTGTRCKELTFGLGTETAQFFGKIEFEDVKIEYGKTRRGSCVQYWNNGKLKTYRTSQNVEDAAFTDVSTILHTPRLDIDNFKTKYFKNGTWTEIVIDENSYRKILNHMKAERRRGRSDLFKLGPRSLTLDQLDGIMETEEFKSAKELDWDTEGIPDGFQMEKLLHFKEIAISKFKFTAENWSKVKNILLKSDDLEWCHLGYYKDRSSKRALDGFLERDAEYDAENHRLSIPDTDHYFQLAFRIKNNGGPFNGLTITKTLNN